MQRQIFNSDHGLLGNFASRFGALLGITGLLLLSACESNDPVTDNDLVEPGADGVPPVLETVTVQPNGNVEPGDSVRIDIMANESLMTPVVYINDVRAEVTGNLMNWTARREMTEFEPDGYITFSIVYQDISGEAGEVVVETTNGSTACIGPSCPSEDELGPLEGNWKLEFAGVGLNPGETDWFSISADSGDRACWFDDIYQFGADGSFRNIQGDETWLEDWQGTDPAACGAPVAPHDGSNNAVFEYDEVAETLTLTGVGAYLGLAKVFSGGELGDPADAPESITYEVFELVGDSLTVRISTGGGWWEFRLSRISTEPVVGNWKLDFAGVGLNEGDTDWFSISADSGDRACWFDDIYHFGDDGSFQNFQGGETWLEDWQGTDPAACGVPVAPHDGSTAGAWDYNEAAGTVTLNGVGAYLGLAKVFDGGELADPAAAPESITYNVFEVLGENMTIRVSTGGGWWEYRLIKD